ncbi:MAG: Putative peptidoglycan binding domain-containing protein [Candidatus Tokpelaia hoelldobleri]|uniref:Peptidoglycan binding domain-containing protein n=1 Tax=Candidatus Tokpelaia hoelldobleri TaxID=1902579 RepID=A0A1U9JW13_9HYPH|nr:MAG: Putative peptidoglycan binding domain-containing protein [Candidatus Tokpelaia hoelldoblerii]
MARKKKKHRKQFRLFRWIAVQIGRLLAASLRGMIRRAWQNPLLASGLAIFALAFGFISKNAFFDQPDTVRPVLFATRAAGPAPTVPQADDDLKALQRKLAALGLYTGDIDGRSGPRTREAIAKWQALQQGDGVTGADRMADPVAMLIHDNMPVAGMQANGVDRSVPRDTVIKVQVALRAFGNGSVVANGVVDRQTKAAVSAFQKMFSLPPSGDIDQALVNKMREIGLLG